MNPYTTFRTAHLFWIQRSPPEMVNKNETESTTPANETAPHLAETEFEATTKVPAAEGAAGEAQETGVKLQAAETPANEEPDRQSAIASKEMTPEERFFAARALVFIAPDVPPVLPRQRQSDYQDFESKTDRDQEPDQSESTSTSTSSRRRTRRRSSDSDAKPEEQTRRERKPAPVITEPQKIKGSTRLEAKKQRRRDGRDAGRRRTVITESEFLARRESVDRQMVVRTVADRVQIGVLEDNVLVEHYVARSSEASLIGNVYLGKVQNVLPSMEAAFVDIGRGRNAVLYSGEVDWSLFEGSHSARKIENALKPGDRVLVQVTKDPVGHKGARLTSQISLPGRFLVYVPGGSMNGISRKLPDTERARLKKILKEVLPTGAGVIVRTAAEGASEEHLTLDVQRLTKQWESIQKRVEKDNAPTLLHSESDMLIKIVRDVFNEDFQRLVISGAETFETINDYVSQVAPELCERLEQFEEDHDIFDKYRITEQISKALDSKVWLPSGGSLVIDRTEAMTVVDVNTGKFVGSGGNLEETVTKNNLEAAEEIVRQLRLRDIGGIIVVDFIDMVLESNRDLVLRRMIECLSRDRTKHQVAEVTSLGLVQMTRKKLGLGLLESFSESCDVCAGRGLIVHHEPVNRHKSETSNRSLKRKNGNSQAQQQHTQPYEISDGAKSMLAKVAASTITKSESTNGEEPSQPEPQKQTKTPRRSQSEGRKPRTQKKAQATPVLDKSKSSPSEPESKNLLDSVLEALPEAPEAGKSRLRSRRATRVQQSTAPRESSDPTDE